MRNRATFLTLGSFELPNTSEKKKADPTLPIKPNGWIPFFCQKKIWIRRNLEKELSPKVLQKYFWNFWCCYFKKFQRFEGSEIYN